MKVSKSNLTSTCLASTNHNSSAPYSQVHTQHNHYLALGEINLKGVNLKPDKATKLLQSIGMPFTLKAGTIGMLKVKVNYFTMFQSTPSAPMEITVNDLFLIVGANLN